MKFGLTDKDYDYIAQMLKEVLGEDVKVWCFGSRARGDHQKFSDLDLMIEGASNLGELDELFIESDLPIKVDIIIENNFAESYRESYLKDRKFFF